MNSRNNLAGDIAIYDRQVLTTDKINAKYVDVPAELIVEVDLKGEVSDMGETGYLTHKTQKLLDFGVKRVLWVLTQPQKILIAEAEQDWRLVDWQKDIVLFEGLIHITRHFSLTRLVLDRICKICRINRMIFRYIQSY